MTLKFTYDRKYYAQPTHLFNLPAGWSCPHAQACHTKTDRDTGKLVQRPDKDKQGLPVAQINGVATYVCYAARAERYPSTRTARWSNYEAVLHLLKTGGKIELPKNVKFLRIHASGDFFSQAYFDLWLDAARRYPEVHMWAYTKSINYWVARLDQIPPNLHLTASLGSKHDNLIHEHGLKYSVVLDDISQVPENMVIDLVDEEAQYSDRPSFAFLENMQNKKQHERVDVAAHNARAMELQGRAV